VLEAAAFLPGLPQEAAAFLPPAAVAVDVPVPLGVAAAVVLAAVTL